MMFSHRVVLRMSSPYFNRVFKSQRPVSPSLGSVFEHTTKPLIYKLDDDDNHEAVNAMLQHMYGKPYDKHRDNILIDANLQAHPAVYLIADKYDRPSARKAALIAFERLQMDMLPSSEYMQFMKKHEEHQGPHPVIAQILGSDAPRSADRSLHNFVIDFCARHLSELMKDDKFEEKMRDGTLFSNDSLMTLLLEVGKR